MREISKVKFMQLLEDGVIMWPPFSYGGRVYGFAPTYEDMPGGLVYFEEV